MRADGSPAMTPDVALVSTPTPMDTGGGQQHRPAGPPQHGPVTQPEAPPSTPAPTAAAPPTAPRQSAPLPEHLAGLEPNIRRSGAGIVLDTFDHKFPAQSNAGMRVAPDPGRFTVDMHGAADRVRVGDQRLSAKDLADIIRANPDWDGEQPIRLISCQTGRNDDGFAAQLAQELGVDVLAPTKDAWIDADGNVFASSAHLDGRGQDFRPGWPPNGEWATFRPDGTSTAHNQSHPPGHTPTWGSDLPDRGPRDVWRRGEHEPADSSMDPRRFQPPQPHSTAPPGTPPPSPTSPVHSGQSESRPQRTGEGQRPAAAATPQQRVHATVDPPAARDLSTSDSPAERTGPLPTESGPTLRDNESTVDFPRDPDYLGNPGQRATEADLAHMRNSPYVQSGAFAEDLATLEDVLRRKPEVAAALEGVPREHLAALVGYAMSQSADLNTALRTGDPAKLAELDGQIRLIASVLNEFPLHQGTVNRAIYLPDAVDLDAALDRYSPGSTVTERNFTSSAAVEGRKLKGNLKFVIESVSGRDISSIAPRNESEVLFPPGTSFEITNKYQDASGTWVIEMREVPTPRLPDGSLADPPLGTTERPTRALSAELGGGDPVPAPVSRLDAMSRLDNPPPPPAPPVRQDPPPPPQAPPAQGLPDRRFDQQQQVDPNAATPPRGLPRQDEPGPVRTPEPPLRPVDPHAPTPPQGLPRQQPGGFPPVRPPQDLPPAPGPRPQPDPALGQHRPLPEAGQGRPQFDPATGAPSRSGQFPPPPAAGSQPGRPPQDVPPGRVPQDPNQFPPQGRPQFDPSRSRTQPNLPAADFQGRPPRVEPPPGPRPPQFGQGQPPMGAPVRRPTGPMPPPPPPRGFPPGGPNPMGRPSGPNPMPPPGGRPMRPAPGPRWNGPPPGAPPMRPAPAPEPATPRDPRNSWGQTEGVRFGPTGSAFPEAHTRPEQARPVESTADFRKRMDDLELRYDNGEVLSTGEQVELNRHRAEMAQLKAERMQAAEQRRLGVSPMPDPGRGRPLGDRLGLDDNDPRSGLRPGDLSRMYSTPAGMSVFPDAEGAHRASAAQVRPDPHSFTVDLHGSPNGVMFGGHNGGRVDPHTLASVIRANPDWAANPRPVRLLACQTDPQFAAQLAAALGQPVTASRSDVWVDNSGNVFASNTTVDNGIRRPGWPPNGEWVTINPDGSLARVHGPYPPGPAPTWGPHQPDFAPEAHQRGAEGPPTEDNSVPPDSPADPGSTTDVPAVPGQQVVFDDGTPYQTQFADNQLDASTGFPANLDEILANAGVSRADFDRMRAQSIEDFVGNTADIQAMTRIREQVQAQPGEMLQRALTAEAAANLLGNAWVPGPPFTDDGGRFGRPDQTKGFTARYADVADLRTPSQVIEGLRLDYTDNGYLDRNGRPPYDFGDEFVATLRFPFDPGSVDLGPNHTGPVTPDQAMPIAYGNHDAADPFPMGGNGRSNPAPFAGHGFTASRDNPVPEFELHPHRFDQAEIWLTDRAGNSVLLGAYDPNLDNGPGNPAGGWRLTDDGQTYTGDQQQLAADHAAAKAAAAAAASAKPDSDPPAAAAPAGPPPSDPPPPPPAATATSGDRTEPGETVPAETEQVPPDQPTMNFAADQPTDAVPDQGADVAEDSSPDAAAQPGEGLPGAGAEFRMDPAEEGLSDAERELRSRNVIGYEEFGDTDHVNPAFEVYFDNDTSAMYKPSDGVPEGLREGIPHTELAEREVAASRVDELLGFGLVPTTTMVTGPLGEGSLQDFVVAGPGRQAADYPLAQQERMAVLDYIAGNTDRHPGNYLTDHDGNLVAIDHGYSFPESPDPEYGIRSDFTAALFQQPLSPEVMAQVRAIEPDALRAVLRGMGLSEDSVEGAAGRLVEVQAHGMINGEAWSGRLKNAGLLTVRGSRH
ncbi:hypothetical protein GCM10010452_07500 [Crossiella cryophila]